MRKLRRAPVVPTISSIYLTFWSDVTPIGDDPFSGTYSVITLISGSDIILKHGITKGAFFTSREIEARFD